MTLHESQFLQSCVDFTGLGEFEHSFQSHVETSQRSNGHIRALRKYCDICEIFDAHDTEDCPQQANHSLNGPFEPGHTYNSITRDTVRPYCISCERFGHETQNCPTESETF